MNVFVTSVQSLSLNAPPSTTFVVWHVPVETRLKGCGNHNNSVAFVLVLFFFYKQNSDRIRGSERASVKTVKRKS